MHINLLFYIGIGGFFGAISRFLISLAATNSLGNSFAYGTLSVNVIGSFLIGILAMYFEQNIAPEYKALFITGFLGALTTFSTFSLETTMMIEQSHYIKAALNIFSNLLFSVGATIVAMILYKKYL
jgi:CrcB protein